MKLTLRKSAERGQVDHGWLKAKHTFSFGSYYDPDHMGFRSLRVINQDVVSAGGGFAPHPHRDMEIITYVIRGEIEHQDSMGHKERIRPGEVQVMSAGTGVVHSEYNPLPDQELELLQIWITPDRTGLKPSYAQARLPADKDMTLIAGPKAAGAALTIHQNARLWVAKLPAGEATELDVTGDRHYWLQVVKGRLRIADRGLEAGDGLGISAEGESKTSKLTLQAEDASEFLVFDLS